MVEFLASSEMRFGTGRTKFAFALVHGKATPGAFAPGLLYFKLSETSGLLGHQDAVDDVDDAIRADDVGLHDFRTIHHHAAVGDFDVQ